MSAAAAPSAARDAPPFKGTAALRGGVGGIGDTPPLAPVTPGCRSSAGPRGNPGISRLPPLSGRPRWRGSVRPPRQRGGCLGAPGTVRAPRTKPQPSGTGRPFVLRNGGAEKVGGERHTDTGPGQTTGPATAPPPRPGGLSRLPGSPRAEGPCGGPEPGRAPRRAWTVLPKPPAAGGAGEPPQPHWPAGGGLAGPPTPRHRDHSTRGLRMFSLMFYWKC